MPKAKYVVKKAHEVSIVASWIEFIIIVKDELSPKNHLNAFIQGICQTNNFDKREAFPIFIE